MPKKNLAYLAAIELLTLLVVASASAAKPKPPPPPPPPVTYHVTWVNLAMPLALNWERPLRDMNDRGDLVGVNRRANNLNYGWAYTEESGVIDVQEIALPPAEGDTLRIHTCSGINNDRIVVGSCILNGGFMAFRMALVLDEAGSPIPATIEILPLPDDAENFVASGTGKINEVGDVTVAWTSVDGVPGIEHLSVLVDGEYIHSSANKDSEYNASLNNSGELVGATVEEGRTYGFISTLDAELGEETDFTVIPGFVEPAAEDERVSVPRDVNDAGEVVGYALAKASSRRSLGYHQAFLREADGTMTNLGVLGNGVHSFASSINVVGDVVGDNGTNGRGFLWTRQHKMMDLKTLVAGDADWNRVDLFQLGRINSALSPGGFGQIAGWARVVLTDGSTEWRIFLLTAED